MPLEVTPNPRGHEKAYAGVSRAGGKTPGRPLDVLERGWNDDGGEGGDDRPPLGILPIGPEIPVAGEQQPRDIRRSRDDEDCGDPEDRIPGAVNPLVFRVEQVAQCEPALSLGRRRCGYRWCCRHASPREIVRTRLSEFEKSSCAPPNRRQPYASAVPPRRAPSFQSGTGTGSSRPRPRTYRSPASHKSQRASGMAPRKIPPTSRGCGPIR